MIHALRVTEDVMHWCTVGCLGQHRLLCVLVGPLCEPAAVIVAWFHVGVVLCENCIVDASIFLFLCFGVIYLDCLCVRVFCYGRMVDALAC